jgi:hypothetical protein
MSKFYIPTNSPEDWKLLLAEPSKQWRAGYSAKSLACCWEEAHDFPTCVKKVYKGSGEEVFQNIKLLVAFPEYQVPLPGGKRATQNDIFILASNGKQLVSITVEGKKSESFGPTVGEWLSDYGKGKEKRLSFLCNLLGLDVNKIEKIRYQLIHRTASAIIMAKEFCADNALMLVHSFSSENRGFEDYSDFLELFGVKGKVDSLVFGKKLDGVDLYFAWVKSTITSWQQPPHLQCYNCSAT